MDEKTTDDLTGANRCRVNRKEHLVPLEPAQDWVHALFCTNGQDG